MKFKTVKNGYDPAEVEEYIIRLREVYDKTLIAQRDRIFEQRESLDAAGKKIAEYESGRALVGKSLESAVSKAEEIKLSARNKYAEEVASLREFHEVWVQYFARIREKYPLDGELKSLNEMNEKINSVLGDAESFVPRNKGGFNPIGMIETLLAASEAEPEKTEKTVKKSFDYDAAQNPDDELVNILGDLGIIHDDK